MLGTKLKSPKGGPRGSRRLKENVITFREMGWSAQEIYSGMDEDAAFWRKMSERLRDQETQLARVEADRFEWYIQPTGDRARYIHRGSNAV